MIDTIKLAYPLDSHLYDLLESRSERLQKISPDGDILWEKSYVQDDFMPSHYSGLRITTRLKKDLEAVGYKVKASCPDLAFFEFSLQKYQSRSAYNNWNSRLETDMNALVYWVADLSGAIGFPFSVNRFSLNRVDLSENFLVLNAKPTDFIRSLELSFSRHPDSVARMSRTGHSIWLKSRWMGKKLYYKGQEFLDIERKKRKIYSDKYCNGEIEASTGDIEPLTPAEINDLMRMVRFECEFKLMYLERNSVKKINDIPTLVERFETEKAKYMKIPVLVKGDLRLSAREEQVINLVRRVGFHEAKKDYTQSHSERSWYRIKRELAARSIFLEALDNLEHRFQGNEVLINPEKLEFQLVSSPFQEEKLAA